MSAELVIMTIVGLIGVAYFAIYRAIVATYQDDFVKKHGTLEPTEKKSQDDFVNMDWESSGVLKHKGVKGLHHGAAIGSQVPESISTDFSHGYDGISFTDHAIDIYD